MDDLYCFLCQEKLTEEHIKAGSRFLKEYIEFEFVKGIVWREVCEDCYIAETIKSKERSIKND